MKKLTGIALCVLALTGCASHGQVEDVEITSEANQKLLRENEHRLSNLENSISSLSSQVEQLNNRVYEVRTRTGQRTAMTVVPVNRQPAATRVAEAPKAAPKAEAQPKAPAAKKIDPAARPAKPAPAQAKAAPAAPRGANGSVGQPETVAGPAGQLASASVSTGNDDLALPPADIPVPGNNSNLTSMIEPVSATTITPMAAPADPAPVPSSDISLPPEHPELAVLPPTEAPAPQAKPQPARAKTNARGEEAAYKTALNAVRSGRIPEGIKLFRDFLQQYPNGRYAANADFWIGECLYSQGKYKDALDQFQVVNNSFPKHHKNADALLKAAMSLDKMGDKEAARSKYQELVASFPNSDAAKRARAMGYGR